MSNHAPTDPSQTPGSTPGLALVTGATSGLGYEAAVHLAEAGHRPVVITGRTPQRAAEASASLVERTGLDVFTPIAADLGDPLSVASAASALAGLGQPIQVAILNAGRVGGPKLERSIVDEEITFASSLTGHHRLTMALLESGSLAPTARIIIAGSEAARGDVPTFNPVSLTDVADEFGGDLVGSAEALIRHRTKIKYKPGNVYATTKLFVAWWAAALAERLPAGMTVNAVSPGSAPNTAAIRHANFFMRRIMVPVLKRAPKRFGLGATTSIAAARYVEVAGRGPTVSGRFFASAPKKMTGPLHEVTLDHVKDTAQAEATWQALVNITGFDTPDADGLAAEKRVVGKRVGN